MGVLEVSDDPKYVAPTHPAEMFGYAVTRAEELTGCVGFSVHRKRGVEWLSLASCMPAGNCTMPAKAGWVTWLFKGKPNKGMLPAPDGCKAGVGWHSVKGSMQRRPQYDHQDDSTEPEDPGVPGVGASLDASMQIGGISVEANVQVATSDTATVHVETTSDPATTSAEDGTVAAVPEEDWLDDEVWEPPTNATTAPEGARYQCRQSGAHGHLQVVVKLEDPRLQPGWVVQHKVVGGKVKEIQGATLHQPCKYVLQVTGDTAGVAEYTVVLQTPDADDAEMVLKGRQVQVELSVTGASPQDVQAALHGKTLAGLQVEVSQLPQQPKKAAPGKGAPPKSSTSGIFTVYAALTGAAGLYSSFDQAGFETALRAHTGDTSAAVLSITDALLGAHRHGLFKVTSAGVEYAWEAEEPAYRHLTPLVTPL